MAPTFAEATAVKATGPHAYEAHFPSEWCIGSVTHGGVVTATLLRVASAHFSTTLAKQNQPHTITLHAEFLRRTHAGSATFAVRDMKLGQQTSTIHISLTQDGREEVVAYLTNTNMDTEAGLTLRTGWSPDPPLPSPPVNFTKLATQGEDENWVVLKNLPHPKLRKAVNRVRMHVPRGGQARPNLVDEWIRLESGERFTSEGLGFVSDMWPQLIEGLVKQQETGGKEPPKQKDGDSQPWLWFPTLTLNLDIKKTLPPEGVEWLHVRVQTKHIKNGRYDYEVVVFDQSGDIVALSHHVAMVLDGTRNTAKRVTGGSSSKI
ncbi:thioesterase-like superfamily-domain-containing protein [Xylaria bambusicola]|uniref:thioesterase-like superfamily-domain-containing protein n=1 Tax=Xylaria bambusicola TaxID=326684 RepID=UPI0020084BAE|nr:thioesterase-like superfamily-domain-containing protein [Xylaria bambusicola]KAI0509277.1 thioesterase-like superfamily-domain-containing protein [Xylaria bambusicola]